MISDFVLLHYVMGPSHTTRVSASVSSRRSTKGALTSFGIRTMPSDTTTGSESSQKRSCPESARPEFSRHEAKLPSDSALKDLARAVATGSLGKQAADSALTTTNTAVKALNPKNQNPRPSSPNQWRKPSKRTARPQHPVVEIQKELHGHVPGLGERPYSLHELGAREA